MGEAHQEIESMIGHIPAFGGLLLKAQIRKLGAKGNLSFLKVLAVNK